MLTTSVFSEGNHEHKQINRGYMKLKVLSRSPELAFYNLRSPNNDIVVCSIVFGGCNYHCEYCVLKEYNRREITTSTEFLGNVFNKIYKDGNTAFLITGGEPFLQSAALFDLVSRLKEKNNAFISVLTNGSLIPKDKEKLEMINEIQIAPHQIEDIIDIMDWYLNTIHKTLGIRLLTDPKRSNDYYHAWADYMSVLIGQHKKKVCVVLKRLKKPEKQFSDDIYLETNHRVKKILDNHGFFAEVADIQKKGYQWFSPSNYVHIYDEDTWGWKPVHKENLKAGR